MGVGGMGAACFVRAPIRIYVFAAASIWRAFVSVQRLLKTPAILLSLFTIDSVRACSCVQNRHSENSSIEM